MEKKKREFVCATCGSDEVKCDAWAAWSVDRQQWEVENTFDNSYCDTCEGECRILEKEI